MRAIVIFTSIITAFGANASDLERAVERHVHANLNFDCEQLAKLVHPDDLSVYEKVVDHSLQSSNRDLVEEELLPLLGVNTREQAVKLTAEETYDNICSNLNAKLPKVDLDTTNTKIEYIHKTLHDDVMVVAYRVNYKLGGRSTDHISQHNYKKYQGSWRVLIDPQALTYFEQYISP